MIIRNFRKPGLACLTILSLQWATWVPPVVAMGQAPPGGRTARKKIEPVKVPPPVLPHVSLTTAVKEYNRHLDQIQGFLEISATRKGRNALFEATKIELRAAMEPLEERLADIRRVLLEQGDGSRLADFDDFANRFRKQHEELRESLIAIGHAATPTARTDAEQRLRKALKARERAERNNILGNAPRRNRGPRWERIHFDTRPPARESTVVPAYLGGATEKSTRDLEPTPDVQITPEIVNLAAELGHSPLKIYEWVRNHTTFEPYFGSKKGSQAALETLAGNDYDLASLTIALLRASDVPARYVRGTVEIPTQRALDWLGVRHPDAVNLMLNGAGIDAIPVVAPDQTVVYFRVDRVWVEALVPHSNYRGAEGSSGTGVWLPLDPAFKLRVYQPGIAGIGAQVPFDEDGYFAGRTGLLAFEWYQNQVREWLRLNLPGRSLGDVPYTGAIEAESLGVLPASLPHEAIAITGEWAEVPEILRHRYQLTLFDAFDNPILDLPGLRTAETSLSRITISYADTAKSAEVVAAFGGRAETPAFLQALNPQLKIDGAVAATGSTVTPGDPIDVRLRYSFPDDDPVEDYFHASRRAGDYHALAMDLNQFSETLMERKSQILIDANAAVGTPGEDADALEGELLSLAGMRYWQRVGQGDKALADLFQYVSVSQISEVLATATTEVLYLFDRPFAVTPVGVNVDARTRSNVPIGIDQDQGMSTALSIVQGRNGSAAEHAVWEEIVHVDSVSTIKALQFANETDVNGDGTPGVGDVVDLVAPGQTSLLCPGFPAVATASMETALAAGKTIKTPYCNFVMNDWHGVGWIEQDPAFGVGGYLILGGLAGGATTLPVSLQRDRWLPTSWRAFRALEECARAAGVEVLVLKAPADVAQLQVPADVRRRIRAELRAGHTVRALAVPVDCGADTQFSYFVGEGRTARGYRALRLRGGSGTQVTPEELIEIIANGIPRGSVILQTCGLPVNLVNGNMYHQFLDLEIRGVGPPLRFERTYNSHSSRLGPMGYGWSHTFDAFIEEDPGVSTTVTDGAGRATTFTDLGGGNFQAPPGVHETLASSAPGWILSFVSGETWTFDGAGRLASIADPHGNALTAAYEPSGRLASVTDALSRTVVLSYGGDGLIDSVQDWTGRTWTYGHDPAGNLISSSTPAGPSTPSYTTNYSYYDLAHLEHNLAQIQFPEGYTIDFEYYVNDKLFRHTESGQRATSYLYQPLKRLTTVFDSRGKENRYSYDPNGLTTHMETPDGATLKLTYDADDNIVEKIDTAGYRWTYSYDDRGRLLTATNPALDTTTYTYGTPFPHPSTLNDYAGELTAFDVDPASGAVTRVVDAESGQTLATYDPQGRRKTLTDPRGGSFQYTYDPQSGRLQKLVLPTTDSFDYTYDALSRRITAADTAGHIAHYEYDVLSRLVRITDKLGRDRRFEYNGMNRLTREIHRDGTATRYTYDALNEPASVIDPLDRELTWSWTDAACRCTTDEMLTKLVAPGGRVWSHTYDDRGRPVTETDPIGQTSYRSWDPRNLVAEQVYPDGTRVRRSYDELGRLVRIEPDGEDPTLFGYDAEGRILSAANGVTTQTWVYDGLGRPTRFEDSLTGKVLQYTYDPGNYRTGVIDGEGLTTSYVFDAAGVLTSIQDFDGDSYGVESDELGRITRLTYPNGQEMVRQFDATGNVLSLTSTGPGGTAIDRSYIHDSANRVIGEQDAVAGDSSYGYDAAGRLLRADRFGRPDEAYAYDAADNRLRDPSKFPVVYDRADRLVQRGATGYRYDARGNLVEIRRPDGSSHFAYTYDNRMRSADLPDGKRVEFRYDPFGRRIEKSVDGQVTRLLRDGDEVLARYDAAGNLLAKYVRTGELARAVAVNRSGQKSFLHQDRRQSTVAVTDAAGAVVARVLYDAWGNIVETEGAWDDPILFVGRDFDAELGLYDLLARHYDPASGRFLQRDPLGIGGGFANRYVYAGNDPVNSLDPNGQELVTAIVVVLGGVAVALSPLLYLLYVTNQEAEKEAALQQQQLNNLRVENLQSGKTTDETVQQTQQKIDAQELKKLETSVEAAEQGFEVIKKCATAGR